MAGMRCMAGKLVSVAGRLSRLEGVAGEGGWRPVARQLGEAGPEIGGMAGRLVRLVRLGVMAGRLVRLVFVTARLLLWLISKKKCPVEESCIFRCYAKLSDLSPPCYIICSMSL